MNFKMILDKYVMTKLNAISPDLYRFITFECYKKLTEISSFMQYEDRYFFHTVSFEISVYCNRKCWYCPNVDNETPNEFMSFDIFKKSIEELKKINFKGIIHYNLYNEPLFDDRLQEFVKYTKEHLPKTTRILLSNGDILNEENAKQLIDAGINKMVITIHDKNPEKNLKRLAPVKKLLKEKIHIQTSYDLYLSNKAGMVDVKDQKKQANYKICPLVRSLVITKNGDIIICCNDYYRKYVMGNIMKSDILTIWNSYSDIRKKLLKDNIAVFDICKKCLNRENN